MAIKEKKIPNLINITGQQFGMLTAQEYIGRSKWRCLCACGRETIAGSGHLKSGHTKSCGCWKLQRISETHKTHGGTKTRLYNTWQKMRERCNKPTDKNFNRYGGRGIKVCEEWEQSFERFQEWAQTNGYADDLTIDRIDNDKGYNPENCRWATEKQQSNNRRSNRLITFNGQTKTLAEWSDILGMKPRTITRRLDKWGWNVKDALTIKPQPTRHIKGGGHGN